MSAFSIGSFQASTSAFSFQANGSALSAQSNASLMSWRSDGGVMQAHSSSASDARRAIGAAVALTSIVAVGSWLLRSRRGP
jgi:hypothetical protein